MKRFKAAILYSGCGVFDGTETMELTGLLFALHKKKFIVENFSLNEELSTKFNYLEGKDEENEILKKQNILNESAKLCRGKIKPLNELIVNNFDCLFIPGGFGIAKNFSNFAYKGENMEVNPKISQIIKEFVDKKKIISATCISPLILSKVLGNITITLGNKGDESLWPYQGTIDLAEKFGSKVVLTDIDQITIDKENRILTNCCFMKNLEDWSQIMDACNLIVDETIKLIDN